MVMTFPWIVIIFRLLFLKKDPKSQKLFGSCFP